MATPQPVTDDQLIEVVKNFWNKHGYAPSVREVGRAVGFSSSSTIAIYLARLRRKGLVLYEPGVARTLRLPEAS